MKQNKMIKKSMLCTLLVASFFCIATNISAKTVCTPDVVIGSKQIQFWWSYNYDDNQLETPLGSIKKYFGNARNNFTVKNGKVDFIDYDYFIDEEKSRIIVKQDKIGSDEYQFQEIDIINKTAKKNPVSITCKEASELVEYKRCVKAGEIVFWWKYYKDSKGNYVETELGRVELPSNPTKHFQFDDKHIIVMHGLKTINEKKDGVAYFYDVYWQLKEDLAENLLRSNSGKKENVYNLTIGNTETIPSASKEYRKPKKYIQYKVECD
jgi:hypothetical protein